MRVMEADPRARRSGGHTHPVAAAVRAHLGEAKVYARDFATRLATYPLLLVISYALWRAIYQQGGDLGVDFNYLVGYYALTLAMTRLVPYGTVATTIGERIYSGDLAITLARPLRVWWLPLAELLAHAAIAFVVVSPLAVIAIILTGASPTTLLAFAGVYLLAANLQFWFYFLLGSLAFWLEHIRGVVYGVSLAMGLLSGALIPLRLFPDTVEGVLSLTPFPYFLYFPVDLLLNPDTVTVSSMLPLLAWSLILPSAALLLHRHGLKQFTGHGI